LLHVEQVDLDRLLEPAEVPGQLFDRLCGGLGTVHRDEELQHWRFLRSVDVSNSSRSGTLKVDGRQTITRVVGAGIGPKPNTRARAAGADFPGRMILDPQRGLYAAHA